MGARTCAVVAGVLVWRARKKVGNYRKYGTARSCEREPGPSAGPGGIDRGAAAGCVDRSALAGYRNPVAGRQLLGYAGADAGLSDDGRGDYMDHRSKDAHGTYVFWHEMG